MVKEFLTREYNNRTVYDCFNNPVTDDFGIQALNLPPIASYDRPCPHKRARYTPDLIPAAISVASENTVITLTTPSDLPRLLLLPSDDPNPTHARMKDESYCIRAKIGYCCREHDDKICYKKTRFYCSMCSDKDKKFYYCHEVSRRNSETRTCFVEYQKCTEQRFS